MSSLATSWRIAAVGRDAAPKPAARTKRSRLKMKGNLHEAPARPCRGKGPGPLGLILLDHVWRGADGAQGRLRQVDAGRPPRQLRDLVGQPCGERRRASRYPGREWRGADGGLRSPKG